MVPRVLVALVVALVALVGSSVVSASVSCSASWQCSSVSADYNYVSCVNGVCQCLVSHGFVGSANISDPCRCEAPRAVSWSQNTPYCISYPVCASSELSTDRLIRLKAKATRVYENMIYPTPPAIMTGKVSVADLFAPNVRGRIDPVGHFDTFATLIEYFYVLSSSPQNRVTRVHIVDVFGQGNLVYIRVDVLFESWDGLAPPFNITQSGRYIFDENDLIQSADLILHNLGKAVNQPEAIHPLTIQGMCGALIQTCPQATDPAGFYTDFNDCVTFLNQIPFGTWDQASSNTVVCRSLHTFLTPYDPLTHCPHAGKTGGGKCIDTPYADYYKQNY